MISPKTIIGVVIAAILIGVLYVSFEKNFLPKNSMNNSQTSTAQELPKNNLPEKTSLITLPSPEPTLSKVNESSNLLNEASNLEMRDYSGLFEELKKINQ